MNISKTKKRMIKIIATVVVCLFFVSNTTFAEVSNNTLSPKLLFSDVQNSAGIRAAVLCELIESRASQWGSKTIEQIYLDDMLLWKRSTEPCFEGFDPVLSLDKKEIKILIPGSNICIRYYDPEKSPTLIPLTDWNKTKTSAVNARINRQILHSIDMLPAGEEPLEKYLKSENYFYPLLSPDMQEIVLRRITDLKKVLIETEDGKKRTIPDFIRHVLSDYGYEDRVENIMVFGSYLFSGKPSDIDIKVGLKGSRQEDVEFVTKIVNINYSEKIKDGSYRVIFPEDSITPVSEVHFTFDGEGFDSANRQEYLAQAHLMSPVVLFGERVYGDQIDRSVFLRKAIEKVESLLENIVQKRTLSKLDSKKAVYRLLHVAGILRKIDPDFKGGITPEKIYEFIEKYYTEGVDPYERSLEALEDLKQYSTPEKCRSILIPFLEQAMCDNILSSDEEKQLEAIEILTNLARYGNFDLESLKTFSIFKQSTSPRVQQAGLVSMMRIAQELSGKESYLPEIAEIAEFLKEKVSELDSDQHSLATDIAQKEKHALSKYVEETKDLIITLIADSREDVLLRVPVEIIDFIGIDNIKDFLGAFQEAPNAHLELFYMSGNDAVNRSVYQKYGLKKRTLPESFERARDNTITLFPALKGEEVSLTTIRTRLGDMDIRPTDTILSPVGLQNDPAGLIRSTIFGLRIMHIARQQKELGSVDKGFLAETLDQYKVLCVSQDIKGFNLTEQDLISIASGGVNQVIRALNKLIRLLPIQPIDTEELRHIYEHARKVLLAA